jgi:methionine synthase II (cobalamin-independent)
MARYLRDIPAWPQLPGRSFAENMYAQYSEGFPGAVMENDRIYVDRSRDNQAALQALYSAYLENRPDDFGIGAEYAAGLRAFLAMPGLAPKAVKGQLTGPLTWGLTVTDQNRKAILHDEVFGDAVPKLLRLKAGWMENALSEVSRNTIIFLDEPYMSAYGSSTSSGSFSSPEKIIGMLDEVFGGISGLKGLHCCGNTDWSVLLRTWLDILSFDTYGFAESLTLYVDAVKQFLSRKGSIAWGIVPNVADALEEETVASLRDRLEEAITPFTRNGLPFRDIIAQSLLTPSCGLATLSEDAAEKALALLSDLSTDIRKRYI